MWDEEARGLARKLITPAMLERQTAFQGEVQRHLGRMNERGLLQSGIAIAGIAALCAGELEVRGQLVMSAFNRVLAARSTRWSPSLADDMKRELASYLEPQRQQLVARLDEESNRLFGRPTPGLSVNSGLLTMKLTAEIDLFVTRLKTAEEAGAEPRVMNFYGPVGAIQTGTQASAVIQQGATAEDERRLAVALEALRDHLQGIDSIGGYPTGEVVSLVDESIVEARKPQPNRLKLATGASAVAVAVQTIAAVRPAYDAIKVALAPFGIHLP